MATLGIQLWLDAGPWATVGLWITGFWAFKCWTFVINFFTPAYGGLWILAHRLDTGLLAGSDLEWFNWSESWVQLVLASAVPWTLLLTRPPLGWFGRIRSVQEGWESRTKSVAHYPGRLRGLVHHDEVQQTARQVAGFELGCNWCNRPIAQCVLEQIFGQLDLADDFSANKIWSDRHGVV